MPIKFLLNFAGIRTHDRPFSPFLAKRSIISYSRGGFPASFELAVVGTASWRGAILLSPQPFFPLGRVRVTLTIGGKITGGVRIDNLGFTGLLFE